MKQGDSEKRTERLLDGLSITFRHDEKGWFFERWESAGGPLSITLEQSDRKRKFDTLEQALAYFRTSYVRSLATSAESAESADAPRHDRDLAIRPSDRPHTISPGGGDASGSR